VRILVAVPAAVQSRGFDRRALTGPFTEISNSVEISALRQPWAVPLRQPRQSPTSPPQALGDPSGAHKARRHWAA